MHSTRARGRRERFTRLERLRSRLRGHPLILLRRALAAALLLVAAVLAVTPGTDREPRVPVLVAARTLPLGSTLSEDDVRVAEVPAELRPDGALVTPDQAVDRRLVGAAREGEPLTDLRVQVCAMLKGMSGFEQQTNENKIFSGPYAACRSADGKRWVITAWEPLHRAWGNAKCPCLHSDPKFPDCAPGATQRLRGWLSFYEGADIKGELRRLAEVRAGGRER